MRYTGLFSESFAATAMAVDTSQLRTSPHARFYQSFFLLRIPQLTINDQPTQTTVSNDGHLTIGCPSVSITFDSLTTEVDTIVKKYGLEGVSNYWCEDVPLFELRLPSHGNLKSFLRSEEKVQKELASRVAGKLTQEQRSPEPVAVYAHTEVYMLTPCPESKDARVIQVSSENLDFCTTLWRESEVFGFEALFNAFHKGILNQDKVTVKLLDMELQEVSDWFGLGIHLDIPPVDLDNLKHNITLHSPQEFRTEMFSVWMRKQPEPNWSRVVKALMEIGRETLAHKIARKYGVPTSFLAEELPQSDTSSQTSSPNLKLLDLELKEVPDWYRLGIHLDIPTAELDPIRYETNIQDCKWKMFSVWMKKLLEPSWSPIVKALMEIGRERLAHKIAKKYGVPASSSAEMMLPQQDTSCQPSIPLQKKLSAEVERLRKQVKAKDRELAAKDKSLEEVKRQKSAVNQKLMQIKENIKQVQMKTIKLIQEKIEAEKQLQLKEKELQLLRTVVQKDSELLQKDSELFQNKEKELISLQQHLQAVQKELACERKLSDDLKEKKLDVEKKVQLKEEELDSLHTVHQNNSEQLQREGELLQNKEKEISELQQCLQAVEAELTTERNLSKELRENLQQVTEELAKKSAVEEEWKEAKQDLKTNLERERQMVDFLRMQLTSASSKDHYIKEMERQLCAARTESDSNAREISQHKFIVGQKEEQIETLSQQLHDKEALIAKLKQEQELAVAREGGAKLELQHEEDILKVTKLRDKLEEAEEGKWEAMSAMRELETAQEHNRWLQSWMRELREKQTIVTEPPAKPKPETMADPELVITPQAPTVVQRILPPVKPKPKREKTVEMEKQQPNSMKDDSDQVGDPPRVTNHPRELKNAVLGKPTMFTAEATGTEPLNYQWLHWKPAGKEGGSEDWQPCPAEWSDGATLTIPSVQKSNEGHYSCVISNCAGSQASNPAGLTVVADPPRVTTHLQELKDAVLGKTVMFTVEATGTEPLNYQWLHWRPAGKEGGSEDWQPCPAEWSDGATLTIPSVQKSNEGHYSCVISNCAGSQASNSAGLTVVADPPRVTTHLQELKDAILGKTVMFTVEATGTEPLNYQWLHWKPAWKEGGSKEWQPCPAGWCDGATLIIPSVQKSNEGSYCCVVSNCAGSQASNPAGLTVADPPRIIIHPRDLKNAVPGQVVMFTAKATGTHPLNYEWQWKPAEDGGSGEWQPCPAEWSDGATLTIPSVQKSNEGSYCCVVSNCAGNQTSKSADLEMCPPLQLPLQLRWRRCRDMEYGMSSYPHCVVLERRVYVGGGYTDYDDAHIVFKYDPDTDNWSRLPRYQYRYFSISIINSRLTVVGGCDDLKVTNQLAVYEPSSQHWTYPYHPMPTPRYDTGVVMYDIWLLVAGGCAAGERELATVELFNTSTNQWLTASSLPTPCGWLTSATINNLGYFITDSKQVYRVSLPDIVSQSVDQSTASKSPTLWRRLPNTPLSCSAAISLRGYLIAVGGYHDNRTRTDIHLYQPESEQWTKVGDLPNARRYCSCVVLPSGELLVAGGRDESSVRTSRVDVASVLN